MHPHPAYRPISLQKEKLITIDFYQTIEDGFKLMKEHSVHHLIVLQNSKVYGVVSDRELYETWGQFGVEKASLRSIGHSCAPAPTLSPQSLLKNAVEQMIEQRCSGVCIADHDGRPLGVITTTDMVQILYRSMDTPPNDEPDMLDKGQVALSHPLMVNLMQLLSEAGI